MVKYDLERGQEVARRREVAYEEGARRRDYCISYFNTLYDIIRSLAWDQMFKYSYVKMILYLFYMYIISFKNDICICAHD